MKVQSLRLKNFRNVSDCALELGPHLNFLFGKNGQGKTSFLESLGYLATLRSFRGSHSDEVIQWGHPWADVQCVMREADLSTELRVHFEKNPSTGTTSKTAFINGKSFRSSTVYLSRRFGDMELGFHAVVFNPSDHDLVRGEPSVRRSYLDRVLSAESLDYLETLSRYQKTLQQRNALLKGDLPPSREMLRGFTEPLARLGAQITYRRLEWLSRVREQLDSVLHRIAPGAPELRAIYVSNWAPETEYLSCSNKHLDNVHFSGQRHAASLEILEHFFCNQLAALEDVELRQRTTLAGPHRDDWTFFLGAQVLRGHGSQGEVRSALLALKLCEIELFRKVTRHRPLLLLDDFSSELDRDRRAYLLRYLRETDLQVLVTTTEATPGLEGIENVTKRFVVENGTANELIDDRPVGLLSRQN